MPGSRARRSAAVGASRAGVPEDGGRQSVRPDGAETIVAPAETDFRAAPARYRCPLAQAVSVVDRSPPAVSMAFGHGGLVHGPGGIMAREAGAGRPPGRNTRMPAAATT